MMGGFGVVNVCSTKYLYVAPLTSHRQTPGFPVGIRRVCFKDAEIWLVVFGAGRLEDFGAVITQFGT